jgi:hypothetical protein
MLLFGKVYGPKDNLFMPNFLEAAGQGMLRVFGNGRNRICFSHVDNYCHGLLLGEPALHRGSPALGKFYIVTDGATHPDPRGCCVFWREMDAMQMGMGNSSIFNKFKLPFGLIMALAYLCSVVGWLLRIRIKLNPFAVKMVNETKTGPFWLTIPF